MNTKLKIALVIFLSFFSIAALAKNVATTATEQDITLNKSEKADGDIIKILLVINQNEIAAANLALRKSSNPSVKEFAEKMITDHTSNLRDTKKLSNKTNLLALDSDQSHSLQIKGKQQFDILDDTKNADFDEKYIDDMVKDHSDALKIIDDSLTKASNPDLKAHLTATKDKVQQHLQSAEEIQKHLSK